MTMCEFFDSRCDHWDDSYVPRLPARVTTAFVGGIRGARVLDIACGTGAMFPELLEAGAAEIVGVDLSEKMTQRARDKFSGDSRIKVICSDLLLLEGGGYDAAVLYNGYPHFLDKPALIKKAAELLVPGGRFTVSHSGGWEAINRHHANVPADVSADLRPAGEEAELWKPLFKVDSIIDTPDFFLISGTATPSK